MSEKLIKKFLKHLIAIGLNKMTIYAYKLQLYVFVRHLESKNIYSLFEINQKHINDYRKSFSFHCTSKSVAYNKIHYIFEFYNWLKNEEYILVNPIVKPRSYRANMIVRAIPNSKKIIKTYRLIKNIGDIFGDRNFVIVDLAYACGLRRCEIVNLNIDDIFVDDGTLRICGKRKKERFVPIGKESIKELINYIYNVRPKFITRPGTNAVFVTRENGGRRISEITITKIFFTYRKRYGLEKSVTAQALRCAFATDQLRSGASLFDVSKMLGHSFIETTQIYTEVTKVDLKKQHKKYHLRG